MSAKTRGWLHRDGGWTTADSLPLTDRGLRYGMAVFETIGIRDGQPLFFEEHARLLSASAKELLDVEIHPMLPALEASDRGVLRIYLTAGDGAPSDQANHPRLFALFETVAGELADHQTAHLHSQAVYPFAHGAK